MLKIVILGHGIGSKIIIEHLYNHPNLDAEVVAVVTHPREYHERDLRLVENQKKIYGDFAYNIFNVTSDYNLPLLESIDVNNEATIQWIKSHNPDYLLSIGCRNIIKSFFLGEFNNKVLNIHTTPLPRYRGAASDSWMILNGESGKRSYGCLHYVDSGIDTGAIIAKEYYEIPPNSYPIDVFKARNSIFTNLIEQALVNLSSTSFIPEIQNNEDSTTFPRLFTPENGRINFGMLRGVEYERFVYAFGYPFEGAHCFVEEKKVNILKVEYKTDIILHTFANGLIFGKTKDNEYKVAVSDGYIVIKIICIDGVEIEQKKVFKIGKRLS